MSLCAYERGMKRRIIAGVMLLTLAGWSVPTALAAATSLRTLKSEAQPSRSSGHHHSCCPGAHTNTDSVLFTAFVPAAMPCGDEHPCCTKQAPENPPSLPAVTQIPRLGAGRNAAGIAELRPSVGSGVARVCGNQNSPSHFSRSTVLRI